MATHKNYSHPSLPLILFLLLSLPAAKAAVPAAAQKQQRPLAVRLQLTGVGSTDCWEALLELRACTGELILFFLNGEAYLGPACCRAIRLIDHSCWPAMLTALGFTEVEGDVLRDYCDSVGHYVPPPPPAEAPGPSAAKLPASPVY